MENNIKEIQEKLMNSLKRLDGAKNDLNEEVARSNAISQLANTYIKSCNLIIRVEESKNGVRNKINGVINNEE
jgi:DNA repair ATPase RecN